MMGVDLTLLPFDSDYPSLNYSHTLLSCERRRELFVLIDRLAQQKGVAVPADFTSYCSRDDKYEEAHYGRTTKDCYGNDVRYLLVQDLITINSSAITDNYLNNAVWAYLRALPPTTKVALFWH